ncbi:MAG: HlyD family efflux transporter periplasmic adaptor subunit [Cyanobacteria bacterium J083]|nr:MAG: HlyD family efflux transporter periplasmic adaptor subunit [Cyanobacteria bacterium J083]
MVRYPAKKQNNIALAKLKTKNGIIVAIIGFLAASIAIVSSLDSREQTLENRAEPIEKNRFQGVTALGRIEPFGEVIKLSPPAEIGGAKIQQLLVSEGDEVVANQLIAILNSYNQQEAAVKLAQQEVKVAEANLAIVKAGAKRGEINAQQAKIRKLQARLRTELTAKLATVSRLQAELDTQTREQMAKIERHKAELVNARSEYSRYQTLAQQGVISQSELDLRRTTLDTARERVKEAEASYQRVRNTLREQIAEARAMANNTEFTLTEEIREAEAELNRIAEIRPVDINKSEAELAKSLASLKQAETNLELTKVKSPTNGKILKINARPGEIVNQNEGILELGQTERMLVVAEVYESDIGQVQVGQRATIISETQAFTEKLTGTVSKILPQIGKKDVLDTDPAADVDSRVVEVKITLEPEDSKKVANLTNSKVIVKIDVE